MGVVIRKWVWLECIGVVSGWCCMGVVIRSWVWIEGIGVLVGVVVRRYIDFLILLIPIPLVL